MGKLKSAGKSARNSIKGARNSIGAKALKVLGRKEPTPQNSYLNMTGFTPEQIRGPLDPYPINNNNHVFGPFIGANPVRLPERKKTNTSNNGTGNFVVVNKNNGKRHTGGSRKKTKKQRNKKKL